MIMCAHFWTVTDDSRPNISKENIYEEHFKSKWYSWIDFNSLNNPFWKPSAINLSIFKSISFVWKVDKNSDQLKGKVPFQNFDSQNFHREFAKGYLLHFFYLFSFFLWDAQAETVCWCRTFRWRHWILLDI